MLCTVARSVFNMHQGSIYKDSSFIHIRSHQLRTVDELDLELVAEFFLFSLHFCTLICFIIKTKAYDMSCEALTVGGAKLGM